MRSAEEITTIINGFDLTGREGVDALEAKVRSNNELAVEVCKFDLETFSGLNDLEQHVRETWTIREIDEFKSFLHGGYFISSADWSTGRMSGIKAPTARADADLQRLWDKLIADCQRMLGAALALHVNGTRLYVRRPTRKVLAVKNGNKTELVKTKHKNVIITTALDFGEDDRMLDYKYHDLAQEVGNAYEAFIKTQAALTRQRDEYKKQLDDLKAKISAHKSA